MFSAESCGPLLPEPPASLCFLMRFARCSAQASPAGPAPTISTSASSCSRWTSAMRFFGFFLGDHGEHKFQFFSRFFSGMHQCEAARDALDFGDPSAIVLLPINGSEVFEFHALQNYTPTGRWRLGRRNRGHLWLLRT